MLCVLCFFIYCSATADLLQDKATAVVAAVDIDLLTAALITAVGSASAVFVISVTVDILMDTKLDIDATAAVNSAVAAVSTSQKKFQTLKVDLRA